MRLFVIILCCLLSIGCKKSSETVQTSAPNNKTEIAKPSKELPLVYKTRKPTIDTEDTPLLLLLHGLGSNEANFYNLTQQVDGRMMVLSVRAPIALASNQYSWYNLNRTDKGWSYNDEEVIAASDLLIRFVDEVIKKYKITGPVYLGGFSQGAIMSLGTAMRHPDKIKGAISLSGELYPCFLDAHRRNYTTLEILVTHGHNDTVLPVGTIKENVKTLISKGLNPDVHFYESAHTISNENYKTFITWLTQSLNKN